MPEPSGRDVHCMKRALALAAKGGRSVRPNPQVGALVVGEWGKILAEGWHIEFGGAHAEVNALDAAGADARGATLYVTLEPCSHQGKTPPCVDRLIDAGLARVVIAHEDPGPEVAGSGVARLREAGIEVTVGELADEAERPNRGYLKVHRRGLPDVLAKWAMSVDGRIATVKGESRYLSGEASRKYVHEMRADADAVMVGVGTVLADDPLLTTRHVEGPTPLRVVLDSACRTPLRAKMLETLDDGKVIVATTSRAPAKRISLLEACGAEVLIVGSVAGRVDPEAVCSALAERDVQYVLVEGGAQLLGALFERHLVDRAAVFVTPRVIGGASAPAAVAGAGFESLAEAASIERLRSRPMGEDVVIEGDVRYAETDEGSGE